MAFGSFERSEDSEANAEINMVPFIDVMLVLLIIFMITAPLMSHAVKVDLPKVSSAPLKSPGKPVDIAIKADGTVLMNQQPVALATLADDLRQFPPETELHLRADRNTSYEKVAQVMAAAATAGLARVGFVTEAPLKAH